MHSLSGIVKMPAHQHKGFIIMSVTRTSLTHPTMIAKLRSALYYAHKGQGHKMNGHGNRCYIANAKGHNIMRLDWIGGRQGYIVYGSESRDVTRIVRNALASVVVRELVSPSQPSIKPVEKGGAIIGYKKRLLLTALKAGGIAAAVCLLTGWTQVTATQVTPLTTLIHNFI
ncbi:hypothetical protein uav_008 [Pseudomonas phage UAVern]|uniref:Uncharacterized protein n=1 Tax=Pseudomonas phage UAVern TaxID=2856997 RepID=A0A975YYN2_9CAUD|nr:hypothetical protein uav_008 [Pseudomonas phage UAVern]